jgi:hypothetical protein
MIILTYDQANQVRGLTVAGHALAPAPLADGTLALPDAVLNDPYHAIHHEYLIANCSIVSDESINNGIMTRPEDDTEPVLVGSDWEQDPEIRAAHAYNEAWQVGEIVVVDPVAAPKQR